MTFCRKALMVERSLLFFLLSATARAKVAAQSTSAAESAIAAGTSNFKCRIVVQVGKEGSPSQSLSGWVPALQLFECLASPDGQ